ncbi:hypothetical protein GE09DRAFT_250058 [Coniochaeta sp. 2T2.1]|nr:hypothetical protein GE09DRAFT_250058 [Coniochaeta sp. 2T2.1]
MMRCGEVHILWVCLTTCDALFLSWFDFHNRFPVISLSLRPSISCPLRLYAPSLEVEKYMSLPRLPTSAWGGLHLTGLFEISVHTTPGDPETRPRLSWHSRTGLRPYFSRKTGKEKRVLLLFL